VERNLLRDVEGLMRPRLTRRLELRLDADPSLPAWCADATQVQQVLFSLRPTRSSSPTAARRPGSSLAPAEGGGQLLLVKVTATGPGMDAATLARLFSRFERGESMRPNPPGGSGLGLEISRNLARLMGGDLQVSSQPGQGSCFSFTLP
jgi:hypothetical protein